MSDRVLALRNAIKDLVDNGSSSDIVNLHRLHQESLAEWESPRNVCKAIECVMEAIVDADQT